MTPERDRLISKVSKLAARQLVQGYYLNGDDGEPEPGEDFCREHAEMVARIVALEIPPDHGVWVASTSMGTDGHRRCNFGGCDRHLDFGGLTDHGVKDALGMFEGVPPEKVSVYASELELAAQAMGDADPKWTLWDLHARIVTNAKGIR